jgi:hypothetical protein
MTKKERLEKLRGMGALAKEVAEMSEKLDKILAAMPKKKRLAKQK